MADKKVYTATGRRKRSVAQVRMTSGKGSIIVNGVDVNEYLDSGDEVYARLNAFRYANNLNPSHIYSKEEIGILSTVKCIKKLKAT